MVIAKPRRIVNPEKIGSPRAARPRPKQTNPAGLYLLGAVNPQRKAMAKKQKKSKKPARKGNPFPFFQKKAAAGRKAHKPKKAMRRPNPEALDLVKEPFNVAKFGLIALIGLVGTRQLPQAVLKGKNSGWMGYLANLATALGGGLLTTKFVGKQAGSAVMIGGGLYLMNRVLSEQLSPIGNVLKLAGTGDAAAAGSLGRIKDAYFPFPVVRDRQGNPIIPKEIDAQAALRAIQQQNKTAAQMSGLSRVSAVSPRMQGRFAA